MIYNTADELISRKPGGSASDRLEEGNRATFNRDGQCLPRSDSVEQLSRVITKIARRRFSHATSVAYMLHNYHNYLKGHIADPPKRTGNRPGSGRVLGEIPVAMLG